MNKKLELTDTEIFYLKEAVSDMIFKLHNEEDIQKIMINISNKLQKLRTN